MRLYNMFWTFGGLILAFLCLAGVTGSQSLYDVQWLPCLFVDEHVRLNEKGHIETKYINREAVLQFGNVGDKPIHPTITFLVTASKVDMRRYLEGSKDTLLCEIRRYSTGGIVMRWPTAGAQDHNVWFTCTIRHTQGLFVITSFLRHATASPAQAQIDFMEWKEISDGDLLTTSAVMVVLTQTPSVKVRLSKEPNLHCKFAVDHKLPHATVEWRLQQHGERSKLFSYSSRTGKTEGSGVDVQAISAGNASIKLPPTSIHSEGTYICSVMVPPLNGSQDISLTISEQPRVSINVISPLTLTLGKGEKLICDAEGYYPLDATIEWYIEESGGSPTSPIMENVRYFSHQHHKDGTYSHSAWFYLQPGLEDSGNKYTCRVSHKSLLSPIHKSFYLIVKGPDYTMWYFVIIAMLVLLFYIFAGRKSARKRLF
ncbi:tapasin-related protein isoform X1 [Carassius gibelio]|uniref:tapasin-related protein isoform X1 n=1 Tax=Carassius gibelio TaxID=101364 RepID=UPI0022784703|nr:tapasin-related protein isoform X1 [Carassius gibelio]